MDQSQLNWLTNFIWNIADDVLRDVYVRGKYRDVILPMTVLRRLDAVLEPTKRNVLEMKAALDKEGIDNQDAALRAAAGQAFYNTSPFLLRDLKSRATRQKLRDDFEAYLDGFSPNVQDILDNFEFLNQIPRLSKADALGLLIEKFLDKDINLSPEPQGELPALDNHSMGNPVRGAGPPLQRGQQRRGWRALDASRRRPAHGQPDVPPGGGADRERHLSAL